MSVTKKLIDIEKLSRYHENLKGVLNTKEAAGAAAAAEAAAKAYADDEIAKLSFDEAGTAKTLADAAEAAAKAYADGLAVNYDAAGAAATALGDAKEYADALVKDADGNLLFDESGAAAEALDAAKEYVDGLAGNYDAAGAAAAAEAAAKAYADGLAGNYDAAGAAAAAEAAAKAYADGLADNYDAAGAADAALAAAKEDAAGKYQVKGNYETAGAAAQALVDAKAYADGLVKNEDGSVKFDDKGAAAGAEAAAKAYADEKDSAMNARVANLEAIDHDQLAADAAASAVATVLDGAPEKFDTLKEVAEWIADSESAATAADLVTRVKALEDIDHEAYVTADAALKSELEGEIAKKVDAVEGSRLMTDAEGTKLAGVQEGAQVNVIESLEVNGVTATIEGKKATVTVDCYTKDEVNAIVEETERVTAESLTDLDARVKDLKDTTYNKTEIDTMVGNVIVVASDEDIDGLFN